MDDVSGESTEEEVPVMGRRELESEGLFIIIIFICPIIQQYAHLRKYDSSRAGQQGPIKTLTAALKRYRREHRAAK